MIPESFLLVALGILALVVLKPAPEDAPWDPLPEELTSKELIEAKSASAPADRGERRTRWTPRTRGNG